MTLTEFRRSGWVKEFAKFDEAELATILLCVNSLIDIGCWLPLVHYCADRIEESLEERVLEDMDTDVLH